jgi:hypothetical protein
VEQFWQRATQIMASGELAVSGTVIRVTRQVRRSHSGSVSDWAIPTLQPNR